MEFVPFLSINFVWAQHQDFDSDRVLSWPQYIEANRHEIDRKIGKPILSLSSSLLAI